MRDRGKKEKERGSNLKKLNGDPIFTPTAEDFNDIVEMEQLQPPRHALHVPFGHRCRED